MTLNQKKASLHRILITVLSIDQYDQENINLVKNESELYGKILKSLHSKHANVFANLLKIYTKDLKYLRMSLLKTEDQVMNKNNFFLYKTSVIEAVETTITYIDEYILVL